MSKNDRVPDPRREYVARQIANHGTNGVVDIEPDADDYAFADYLIRSVDDMHGYIAGTRTALIILATALVTAALTFWF